MRRVDVQGRRVLVTGGARGIGAATATLFAARGAWVWIGDVDDDACRHTAQELGVNAVRLDVTSTGSWQDVIDRIEADGPLDLLVNNAGVMPIGPLEDETEQVRDLILDVNVRGVLNGMQAAVPAMVRRGRGHVINVASMAGMIPIPGMVTYNASKFAVLGASLAARQEYSGTGVTVSAILPSAVRTELASGAPLGGGMPTVDPEDVAAAILDVVRSKAARRSVPRWVAPAWDARAFVPERVQNLARRLVDDRRALTAIDADARADYSDRVNRQARAHAAEGSR
jgi:NAD(P)-dependent dehydrogenase (short-subunit alcohol dehydrogenase family)